MIKKLEIDGLETGDLVTIYNSTAGGEIAVKGIVNSIVAPPWYVYLATSEHEGFCKETMIEPFLFLAENSGITKIEKDGYILYENTRIPVPYKPFDLQTHRGQIALNSLRKNCFGCGFGYVFKNEDWIRRDNKERRQKELEDMFKTLVELREKYNDDFENLTYIVRSQKGKGYLSKKEADILIQRLKQYNYSRQLSPD
jgi:hypothetical protein